MGVNVQAYEAVCTPVDVRKAPRTIVQAQFSIPYTVATALIDGAVRLGHFTDEGLRRQDILALAQKVEGCVDDGIELTAGRNVTPADVHVEMEDGTTHRLRMDIPLGHPSRPMSEADFEAKALDCFRAAARPMRDGSHQELRQFVSKLEALGDARTLARVLQPVA